ncbi:MAG: TrkA family potassium uptake protein [Candidatus Aenigmatarchaeota archaeon]
MKVLIAGGGSLGTSLVKSLLDNGFEVSVIEKYEKKAEELKKNFGINVVVGDATDTLKLEEAGIKEADVIICATPEESINAFIGLLAKEYGVKKIFIRVREKKIVPFLLKMGLTNFFSSEEMTAKYLLEMLREEVIKVMPIDSNKKIFFIKATKLLNVIGKSMDKIVGDGYRILFLIRKNGEVAFSKSIIEEGDNLVLFSSLDSKVLFDKLR